MLQYWGLITQLTRSLIVPFLIFLLQCSRAFRGEAAFRLVRCRSTYVLRKSLSRRFQHVSGDATWGVFALLWAARAPNRDQNLLDTPFNGAIWVFEYFESVKQCRPKVKLEPGSGAGAPAPKAAAKPHKVCWRGSRIRLTSYRIYIHYLTRIDTKNLVFT